MMLRIVRRGQCVRFCASKNAQLPLSVRYIQSQWLLCCYHLFADITCDCVNFRSDISRSFLHSKASVKTAPSASVKSSLSSCAKIDSKTTGIHSMLRSVPLRVHTENVHTAAQPCSLLRFTPATSCSLPSIKNAL